MGRVLVTGGTGTLGSQLLPRLLTAGHDVVSLTRHTPASPLPDVTYRRGDVLSGAGVADATAGVDTVVHTATSPRASRRAELRGTTTMATAAGAVGAHLIYISIVGVDVMGFAYYKGKSQSEQVVADSGTGWTVQRATQFHDLLDRFLGWKIFPVTKNMSFQPVDSGEVADRLVALVEAGPSGRVPDMGGPVVVPLRQLAATRRAVTGSSAFLLPVPPVGPLAGFDQGRHLCPDHADGRITWDHWLTTAPR